MSVEAMKDRTFFIILIALISMTACAIIIIIIFMFLGAFFPDSASVTLESSDPVWLRIQNSGKMVVGVSADNPPFSFVKSDFTLQGYDLALIQEIGKRLEISLEIHNLASDGLVNALILDQIDIAVASLSITPERDQMVDFSNAYYANEDALLARSDSQIQITSFPDLALHRLGVQNGSVYEYFALKKFLDSGLMSRESLLTYQTMDEAIQALTRSDPEIDLFILDLLSAEEASKLKPVKIVSQGLFPQNYAIGMAQGAHTLQNRINQVLSEMQSDGTLSVMAKQYLNVEIAPALPTPEPTQAPATPSACLDGMQLVQDLTLPDQQMTQLTIVKQDQAIQKGWRIQNTGTCSWGYFYFLSYIGGVPNDVFLGGEPVTIQGEIAPGQTYDIYVTITAPDQPGAYQSFWGIQNRQGVFFGEKIWAGFQVVDQGKPVDQP